VKFLFKRTHLKKEMESTGENVGVYAEAKGEYTRQLCQFLVPALLGYFLQMVDEAKEKDTDAKKLLWNFQNLLKDVPDWNVDKVRRETTTIQTLAKCDYLEELLTAVFIAHTKVLSAIRLTTKNKKLQISIPKLDHFLHRTLGDCARLIWSNVYLFTPTGTPVERQKNLNLVEGLLGEGILQSIRTMLPVKSILREYLHDDGEEEEESEPVIPVATPAPAPVPVPVTDLSANTVVPAPVPAPVPEPEPVEVPAPAPIPVEVPAPAPEEVPAPAPVPEEVPVEAPVPAPAPAPVQTIVVDTEPSVRFTNIDSVFHHSDPEQNIMSEVNTIENDYDEDTLQFVDAPPTGLDGDYEELS
jgi:hypothetical protein